MYPCLVTLYITWQGNAQHWLYTAWWLENHITTQLLYGVPDNLLRKVQSVQNSAVRLLTSTRRCDHITPLLRQLHWLPVQRRVEFKIACIVDQSLASLAPTYPTTDIHLVSEYGRRALRSSTDRTLTVPRTHNRFGDALLLQGLVCGTVCR